MLRVFLILLLASSLYGNESLSFFSSAPLGLKRSQLRDLYLGKLFEINKVQVRPVVLKEGETHNLFLKNYVFKTSSQFSRHWKKMLFTGKATPPPSVKKEDKGMELLKSKISFEGAWIFYSIQKEAPEGLFKVELLP